MLVSCCNSTRLLIVNRFLADMAGQREGGKATRDCIANRKRLTTYTCLLTSGPRQHWEDLGAIREKALSDRSLHGKVNLVAHTTIYYVWCGFGSEIDDLFPHLPPFAG